MNVGRSRNREPAAHNLLPPVFFGLVAGFYAAGGHSHGAARTLRVPLVPAETLHVQVSGEGTPAVLIPGLFGSGYTFRKVVPLLNERGYRTIVIEPLGVGASSRPARADYSLTAQG